MRATIYDSRGNWVCGLEFTSKRKWEVILGRIDNDVLQSVNSTPFVGPGTSTAATRFTLPNQYELCIGY